ncbi:MAG: hypothetical protein ACI31F_05775 [Muribaculaceae bacterium]
MARIIPPIENILHIQKTKTLTIPAHIPRYRHGTQTASTMHRSLHLHILHLPHPAYHLPKHLPPPQMTYSPK